jgi:hypothetical protein
MGKNMENRSELLDRKFANLYSSYYKNNDFLSIKRELSAIESVRNIASATKNIDCERLVDVGAGDGNVLFQLSKSGLVKDMVALEISKSGIELIESRSIPQLSEVRKFDGYTIPYPNKHFDLAIAIHVLEHVEHERLFLKELGRVSKRLFIEVPLEHGFNVQRSIVNGRSTGHINFYTIETIQNLLESAGFKVLCSAVVTSSLRYEQLLYGRIKGFIKNKIRTTLLSVIPSLAPKFFTYNGYVYCECF